MFARGTPLLFILVNPEHTFSLSSSLKVLPQMIGSECFLKSVHHVITFPDTLECYTIESVAESLQFKVINIRSDTFGNPVFQKVLQN